MDNIRDNQLIIDGDYVYFKSEVLIAGIVDSFLCRQKITTKKQYILNKNKNHITDSKEIFQEYLQKKKEGKRGYKTIKIGIIEKYPKADTVEFRIVGSDGKYDWWRDWEGKARISSEIKNHILNHKKAMTSEFIPA